MAPLNEQIRAALAELLADEEYTLPLKSLPLGALSRWQESNAARAAEGLQQQTTGPDELKSVPHGRLYATSHANIVLNTTTVVTMNAVSHNQGMMKPGQASRLYAPRDGLYYLQGNFIWDGNAVFTGFVQTYLRLTLLGGGFRDVALVQGDHDNADAGHNLSTIARMRREEYVELVVYTDQGTAVVINNQAAPVLTAFWVGNYSTEEITFNP